MSAPDIVLARMRAQRSFWVDLEPGKRVQVIRPTALETSRHLFRTAEGGNVTLAVDYEDVMRFTIGWEGFSEADLLGAAVGSSDPLPFDAALWQELSADHPDWWLAIAQKLLDAVMDHQQALIGDQKNSQPS